MNRQAQAGYTLISLMAAIAVSGILMATIAPTWQFIVKRDKEEELIFRGEQYKIALERYKAKFNALPTRIEDLFKQKMIRKLYIDPITNGPFELIYYSPAGNQRASQLDPKLLEQALREGPGKTSMPIIGVVSMSPDEALRPYKDKQHYNEWEFIAGEQQQQEEGDEETDTDDEDEEEPEGF